MKKITILSLFALLCSFSESIAQSGFGIKGGINFNKVYTDAGSLNNNIKESLDTQTGYVLGAFGRIGNKVYLQPEVLFAQRGGVVETTQYGKVKFKYSNIDVPVLVGVRVLKFFRIMGGPVATFKLDEDKKLSESIKSYTSGSFDDAMKKATFGYQVGVGVKILGFDIDLRKEGSLSEISQLNLQGNSQFSQKASGWQITLALKII
ncbi:porin family protein [Emticicia sp. BO119]|uniref:porin family protein n=1 Tax=Emticicia sp. BO119 TaxID=2757768 RepID=UPI0015F04F71|nr:porin family protein [Emticicia sp. BO119]MBA4853300.1 PorT family protein [Emticicia sp. BO119]